MPTIPCLYYTTHTAKLRWMVLFICGLGFTGKAQITINGSGSYATIQSAVNAASSGDNIAVPAGLYVENIIINKTLTLNGANAGIDGCSLSRLAESTLSGGAGTALTLAANGITIDGFEITGITGIASTGYTNINILNNKLFVGALGLNANNITTSPGNTYTITDNCIQLTTQLAGPNPTIGIALNGASGTEAISINRNQVTNAFYGYVAYSINTTPVSVISNGIIAGVLQGIAVVNTTGGPLASSGLFISGMNMSAFSGNYPALSAQNFHAGIYTFTTATTVLSNGINLSIKNCIIDGTQSNSPSGAGIYLGDFSTGGTTVQTITINECNINNNSNRGLDARGYVNAVVTQSGFTGNGNAPWGTGGNYGFTLIAQRGAKVSAANNFIVHPASSTHSVTAFFNGNIPANTIIAAENSVLMNGNALALGADNTFNASNTLIANCNWWGTTGAGIIPLISGPVTYQLSLNSGTDNAPATPGFQPLPNSCSGCLSGGVVQNTNTLEYFCSIQAAINAATTLNGHTLIVSAGTYPENVTLNKSLTITGAQAGSDGRNRVIGSPDPLIESVIAPATGACIELLAGSSGAVIDGFSMKGNVSGTNGVIQTLTAVLGNIQIKNNYIKVTSVNGQALWFNRGLVDATIDKNEMAGGASSTQIIFLNGPQSFAGLYLTNNNILGGGGTYGLFVDGNRNVGTSSTPRSPLFQGNLFQGLVAGMNAGSRSLQDVSFIENTFNNNTQLGFQGGPKNSIFARNTFTGNGLYGMALTAFGSSDPLRGAQGTSIRNNVFNGNATSPGAFGDILLSNQTTGTQASNLITENSFGSNIAIYDNEVDGGTDPINAPCNWYGSFLSAAVQAKIFTAPGAVVNHTPWLTNGTDNDLVTLGFQPQPGSCNGTNMSPTISCPAPGNYQCATEVPAPNPLLVTTGGGCPGITITWEGDLISDQVCTNRYNITRTYKATDGCGNMASCTQLLTIYDNIPPAFTPPADITIPFLSSCSYDASISNTGNITGASDNCSDTLNTSYTDVVTTCGNDTKIIRTWHVQDICGNAATDQVQTITVSDNNSGYIIYATNEVRFGENNTINGDVGVTAVDGKAEFKRGDQLDPYHVYAQSITVQSPASVNNRHFMPATGGPNPPFYSYAGGGLTGNYTAVVNGIIPAGDFKNLTIKKGIISTVNGSNYGKINIEEGAQVTFTSNSIDVEEISIGKGKHNGTTNVYFTGCAGVRVKDKVNIEEDCRVNVGGPKVTVYLSDPKKGIEKFTVKGNNTQVTLNIYLPNGKLKVNGGNVSGIMTGWFVVEKLESVSKNIIWNKNDCYILSPLLNQGIHSEQIISNKNQGALTVNRTNELLINVYPNPSSRNFLIQVNRPGNDLIQLRIFDVMGKTMQVISNASANSTIEVGNDLRQGTYFVEVRQGEYFQTIRLLKIE